MAANQIHNLLHFADGRDGALFSLFRSESLDYWLGRIECRRVRLFSSGMDCAEFRRLLFAVWQVQ